MPSDKTFGPLWKVVRGHLKLEPDKMQKDDVRKVLVGLGSIVDGIGALRTHNHDRGVRRTARLFSNFEQPRT